jgi:hypothetical protein
MTEFEDDVLNPDVIVQCKTAEQAAKLLAWYQSKGVVWCTPEPIDLAETLWGHFGADTGYSIDDDRLSYTDTRRCSPEIIIPFSEALKGGRIES